MPEIIRVNGCDLGKVYCAEECPEREHGLYVQQKKGLSWTITHEED